MAWVREGGERDEGGQGWVVEIKTKAWIIAR